MKSDRQEYDRYLGFETGKNEKDLVVYMHWSYKEPNPKLFQWIYKNPKWISIHSILETFSSPVESEYIYFSINSENGLSLSIENHCMKIQLT